MITSVIKRMINGNILSFSYIYKHIPSVDPHLAFFKLIIESKEIYPYHHNNKVIFSQKQL